MIYLKKKLHGLLLRHYFAWNSCVTRTRKIHRKRLIRGSLQRQLGREREVAAALRKRAVSTPRETVDFDATKWGKLVKKLAPMNDGFGPSIESRDGKLFRRRFRVPWQVYCDLVKKCTDDKLFGPSSTTEVDICGYNICPPSIKLLGVLRMLGRNWLCDDVAEATCMGESTVRRAFATFTENFVEKYYASTVYRPTGLKLERMMAVYAKMGLDGCVGSTDCVHVKWDRCPIELTNLCKGKEGKR